MSDTDAENTDAPAPDELPAAHFEPPPEASQAAASPDESPGDGAEDGPAPPPKSRLWSRLSAAAGKAASATRDAAGRVAHVTAEITRESVSVAQKGASESASMAKHAYSHMDEVRDQTGAAFAKVGRSVSEASIGIAQSASKTIATASSDAVRALVRNVNETLPYIERAGYTVSEIELGLSVPPKVVMHLGMGEELSDPVREALLKDCEGKWFTRQIIERLHNIRQIQRATQFVGMAFDEIEIEIALIPSVLIHYRKVHSRLKLPVAAPLADAAQAFEDGQEAAAAAAQTAFAEMALGLDPTVADAEPVVVAMSADTAEPAADSLSAREATAHAPKDDS